MKRALWQLLLAGAVCGGCERQSVPSERAGASDQATQADFPSGLVLADLPVGVTVRKEHGVDFDVYRFSSGGHALAGIYVGGYPRFPVHELTEGDTEVRDETPEGPTAMFTRDGTLVCLERLFRRPSRLEADDRSTGTGEVTAAPPPDQGPYGWVDAVHVFTDCSAGNDPRAPALLGEAIALVRSVRLAPELRAAWDTPR